MSMFSPDDSDQNPFSRGDFSLEDLPFKPSSILKWALVLIGIVSLVILSHVLKGIYTDLLWFDNMDYKNVYMKILTTKIYLFLGGGLLFTVIILPSVVYVYRKTVGDPIETIPIEIQPLVNKVIKILIGLAILILAITFGSLLSSQWETLLRFFNEVDFTRINPTTGQTISATEPVFDKNIGFYVFNIPMFILLQEWFQGVMIVV
ncbi:uncharacterized protein METZ01_LOCUS300925, partial [marine metagenome]